MFLLRKIRRRIKDICAILAAITVAFYVGGNDAQSEPTSETKGLILSTTQSETTAIAQNETSALSDEAETYIILADDMTIIKGKGASFSDGIVTVSKSGTYSFKGELKDGRIIVDLVDDGEVKLNFYGVNVNSTKGAPLSVIKAPDKAVLYFDERTVNDFSDTEDRVYTYDEDMGDSAVIFSEEDIVFEGNGFVRIQADFNKGIFSKKDITLKDAKVNIASFDDGIRCNETVRIKNSEVVLASGGDGIHTSENKLGKNGKVIIGDSTITYVGVSDGIDSAGEVLFYGGEADFLISGGSKGKYFRKNHSSVLDDSKAPDMNKNDILSAGRATADSSTFENAMGQHTENAAVTVGGNAVFNDVNLKIDSAYHGIIGENIEIEDSFCSVKSDGNGLFAEDEVSLEGVKINISGCYNGIECEEGQFNNGNILIKAFNEGIICTDEAPDFEDVSVEIKDKNSTIPHKP